MEELIKCNYFTKFFILVLIFLSIFTYYNFYHRQYSLNSVLDYYGYKSDTQKKALISLFQQASINIDYNLFIQNSSEKQLVENSSGNTRKIYH